METVTVTFTVPKPYKDYIRQLSQDSGLKMSEIFRRLLDEHKQKHGTSTNS